MAELALPQQKPPLAIPRRQRSARRTPPWRRHLRTTREGKAFIMVTLGVGIAAFNTGNNLLFLILGFMLSLIVLSGVMSETVIKGVRVTRAVPQRAFAGKTCLVELVLKNNKPRSPSYSLEIEDIAEDGPTERRCYFLKVAPGAEQSAAYRRTPKTRGTLQFTGFRVATRYPFGIFEKWRTLEAPGEMLVYPALLDEPAVQDDARSVGVDAPTHRIGTGTEIAGLRGYEVGDDARSIHWKRSASLGRLVVIERQSDASSQVAILLDNARGGESRSAETFDAGFELAVSEAATLAVASLARGLSVEVIARGSRSPLVMAGAPPDAILRYLALLAAQPAGHAQVFGAYARTARVIRIGVRGATELAT
ncbi:MAG TPA: DUF58 domain-containing protein [Polyangiales bacterium]|jgi:uncharacterized protein (DUF58 family)|nr:DUF58 domain-containing protein [Polyangiales bacterium]